MKLAKNQALVDSYLSLLPPAIFTSKALPIIGGQATAEAISKLAETVKGYVPKLWEGDWQSLGKYPSQSEADFALCALLSQEALIQRIPDDALHNAVFESFALSGLYRPEKASKIATYAIPKQLASKLQARQEFINSLRDKGIALSNDASNDNNHEPVTIIEEKTGAPKFKLIPASDLLASPPPPRDWVIKNFLSSKIVAAIIAPGGAGKSYLAMHIAVSTASGSSLFSKFLPTKPSKVVFIRGEDDKIELQRRIHAVTQDLPTSLKASISTNIFFIDLADSFELFTNKSMTGEVFMTDIPRMLVECIKETAGDEVDLVIVDPISRFRGGEENSAADTTRFVQALQFFRDKLNTTVLTLHHVNKGAKSNGTSQNNARGSSAFIDGVRLVYELNILSDEEIKKHYGSPLIMPRLLTLSTVKTNYGSPIDPLVLSKRIDGSLELFNIPAGEHQKLAILQEIKISKLTKTQFKETYGDVNGKFGLSEKSLVKKLDDFEREKLIEITSRSPMQLTKLGDALITA
jgi:hypothetical protein